MTTLDTPEVVSKFCLLLKSVPGLSYKCYHSRSKWVYDLNSFHNRVITNVTMSSTNSIEDLLQAVANRLHSDVPIHVPARRHIRMWRPMRAGLFSTASIGLFDASAAESAAGNGLHQDKAHFLTEIRDFIDYLQNDEVSKLRDSEPETRNGNAEAPFLGLHGQINQILSGGRRISGADLPLRNATE